MTKEFLIAATGGNAKAAEALLPYIIETCEMFEINTLKRQLAFLSQVGHESGGLFYTEELASGEAYNNRKDLGNTSPGDGPLYKGRGLIQITGKANYKSLSEAVHKDLVANPKLLGGKNTGVSTADQLRLSALSAGWYWNKTKLNQYADLMNPAVGVTAEPNLSNYKTITKKINGGYNGLEDRQKRYEAGRTYAAKNNMS